MSSLFCRSRPGWRLLLLCLAVPLTLTACSPDQPAFNALDVTGATYAADFRLRDAQGQERTLADYRGKAVMVFFGFTQCPDVCPTALLRAAEMRQWLGAPLADQVQVLFITLDPERDTPEVLGAYTTAFDPAFVGLHGDAATIAATANAFRVFYRKVPTGTSYTLDHSANSYVYDRDGRLRLVVAHELPAESLAADLRTLLDVSPR